METFNKYLEIQDLNPSRLKVTDEAVNDFVDFFLAQESGRLCQSEEGLSCNCKTTYSIRHKKSTTDT